MNEVLQNPETVGTAFKSLSARLRGSTTELEELGEEATVTTSKLRGLVKGLTGVDIQKDENTFKSIYDILLEIGKEWKNLTDVEQASLSEALFGKRNSQVGFAILNNVDRLQEIYALAENSEGSAMAEQEKYLEGVQYRIDQFQASVENLANTFMSSDFLKGMVQTGTTLVDILADIIDNLGTIPALIGAIGTAIGSKQNLFFNLAELGFTKDDKVLPLVPNSDLGALASTNNIKQLRALATEYANLGTKEANTKFTHEQFIAKVSEGNIEFATWLEEAGKDAPNKLKSYQKSLVATTLRTTALRAVTMALQGALFAIAGVILTKVVSAISDWVHANERAIETGEEASRTISEINNSLETQQQTVKDSAKRFAELSQGVDQLTGKNLSLSDEDYQEFLNISNQLADVFPSLTRHYDENGNAIVDLDGDVNTIASSLRNLLEVEEKLAQQKILDNASDLFDAAIAKNKKLVDDGLYITADDSQLLPKYKEALDSIGIANEVYGALSGEGGSLKISDISKITRENIDKIVEEYGRDLPELVRQLNDIQQKALSNYQSLSSVIATYLYSEYDFAKLSPELQAGVQNLVNNLDWTALDFHSWEEATSWIMDNIVRKIGNDDTLSKTFELSLEANTIFNNGEISVGEYQKKIKDLLPLLEGLDDETRKSIELVLGLEFDSDGNIINTQVNNLTKQLESFVGEESAKAISEGLTKGELEAVQNSDINWAQILNKNQSLDTQIQIIKQKIASISQAPFEINLDTKDLEATTSSIKELQSAYQTLYEAMQEGKEGSDLAFLMSDIEGLKEKLVDAEGNVVDLGDTWNNFFDIMTDGSHSFEEMEDALNQVLTAYVNSIVDLENFDRAQADAISTQLQLAGVTQESADAYVDAMVKEAEAVQWATDEGYNFATMSEEEIAAMLALAEQSGYSSSALAAYALEKQIVNGITITTSGDINNLIALAEAAGVTTARLAQLAEAKRLLETAEASGDANTANLQRARIKYLTTRAQEDTLAQLKALRNQSANLNYDPSKATSSKSGSGGSSKESDPWKDAYDKELAALDHLHEMELISDIQYYEEREKLNDKYFKDNTKYTEEYNKNLEEIYKGFQSAYKQYVDDMSDYWKKSLDAGKISFQQYCNNMKSMLDDLHNARKIDDQTYYSELAEYYGTIVENYDKVISAVQRRIKKEIDGLEKEKDRLKENYELRKKTIQSQIDSIQVEIDALENANKKRQEALDLQKALYDLNRAENQRNRFVYNSDKGFIYEASEADIKEAQDNLEDVRYQQKVSALEQQITSLEEQIDLLDNELDELTARLDKQIDDLQAYSDRWGEVADKYREAQEDMIAAAVLGSNWQNEILALNESTLSAFTTNYINMQAQQAQAAINAANDIVNSYQRQIQALNEWKEAQATAAQTGSSTSNNGGKTTVSKTPVKVNSVKYNAPAQKVQRGSNQYMNPNTKNQRIKQYSYGSGTDNAKPGIHEIAESGKEIVLDNYGNAYLADGHQLHRFEGGEKVYDANETKELLNGKYIPIDSILPNYSSMLEKVLNSNVTNNYSPTKALVTPKNNNQLNKVDNSINVTIGDIHVTEVDDASQFARVITNELPNALLQELRRK